MERKINQPNLSRSFKPGDFAEMIQSSYTDSIHFFCIVNDTWAGADLQSGSTVCLWRIKLKTKPIHQ